MTSRARRKRQYSKKEGAHKGHRGRPPGRWAVPWLRPVMHSSLGEDASAEQVARALADFSPSTRDLCERTISSLYNRSALGHEKKTRDIAEGLKRFCENEGAIGPKQRIAHIYDSAINPSDFSSALRYIERVLDTDDPRAAIAEKATMAPTIIRAAESGVAMPPLVTQRLALVMNEFGGPQVQPVPWASMSWGREFVSRGDVRMVIEEWIVRIES